MPPPIDRIALTRRQKSSLRLNGAQSLRTPSDAETFMDHVGIALRYQATPGLALASLRSAAGPDDDKSALVHAINLTNGLLGQASAIEVNVVAGRLVLVNASLMPALYRLVRRGRPADDVDGLDMGARSAIALITARREISVGDLRAHLGVTSPKRPDAADKALASLQRVLLVDRGPFERRATGIPYLSKEGYPYHLLHRAHPDLVAAAATLNDQQAADVWIAGYLDGAVFATPRTLASLFRQFLTSAAIGASLDRLVAKKRVTMQTLAKETLAITKAQ